MSDITRGHHMAVGAVRTLGDVARRHHIPLWRVRRVYERGILPEPARAGRYRVVSDEELPKLEEALRAAGYLAAEVAHGA